LYILSAGFGHSKDKINPPCFNGKGDLLSELQDIL